MPVLSQKGLASMIWMLGLLVAVALIGSSAYNLGSLKSSYEEPVITQDSTNPSANLEVNTKRVLIGGEYYFDISVPPGYSIVEAPNTGSLTRDILTIQDGSGQNIMSIYTFAAGESSPKGSMVIDGVPFTIDYFKEVQCLTDIGAANWVPGTEPLFNIHLNCNNATEQQLSEYTKILQDIRFSPQLKTVLMGEL